MSKTVSREVLSFKSQSLFRKWLVKNHASHHGIWLRIFKKGADEKSIAYQEALEEALCFGWIDGQKDKYDDESWLQKFSPRLSKSVWSARNIKIVKKLIEEKRMHRSGLLQVENAKADGRWDKAYESQKDAAIPEDFLSRVKKNKKAFKFFLTLNKTNLYSIYWRLQTAKKPETRERRIVAIIAMLEKGEKFH
ncbi:MAG: YdeI/OmpD-associated family protein [Bacteriovoracaceae bacterium]